MIQDIESLRRLYRELEEDAVRYQPEHFIIGFREDSYFADIINSSNQDILIVEDENKIVGFAHVMIIKQKKISCLKPETVLYIQDLDVQADMRSRGIGSMLMVASKKYGKEHGADFVRIQVFPNNERGIKYYEKNGFSEMMKTMECHL